MKATESKWKFVVDYPVAHYKCGAKAGDRVRFRQTFEVMDHKGNPTGVFHRAGEIWEVLSGAEVKTIVVWLRQPDGKRHTWDDTKEFWESFEKVA